MANLRDTYIFWLVVLIILKYSMRKSMGRIIPCILWNIKNVPSHKPVCIYIYYYYLIQLHYSMTCVCAYYIFLKINVCRCFFAKYWWVVGTSYYLSRYSSEPGISHQQIPSVLDIIIGVSPHIFHQKHHGKVTLRCRKNIVCRSFP